MRSRFKQVKTWDGDDIMDYHEYIKSSEWKRKRKLALQNANWKCEKCDSYSFRGRFLEVHHKTYANLGDEPLEDLIVLCNTCHPVEDSRRKYNKALNTYATKKYGYDWHFEQDYDEVQEEFDNWLEAKEDENYD